MNDFKDVLRRIKESVDIVEIIGRTVQLKKAGASFKGRCPFHQEKTPSFNVIPGKMMFHCFGCGVGGSVVDFVMKSERLEFKEAVEKLAKEAGIELPRLSRRDPAQVDAERQLQQTVLKANEAAQAFFRKNLAERKNPIANDYIPQRGLSPEMVERFQLGASLEAWDGLKLHLGRLGFSEDAMVDAGLCVRSENGRVYDRFRHRLMFPIHDANNRLCGFGGRQLVKEEHSPKYLNSAETALYHKSLMLYGLNVAKDDIAKSGYAIVCEGYLDVITAHAHGHTQAVASLGTALTREQAKLLKRFAAKTYFLYDGDSAGQKAMLRGGPALLESDFDVRVISLPAEDDPDTFLQTNGGKALHELMGSAEEFFDYALRAEEQHVDLNTLAGQAELVERMAPILAVFRNDVMREGAIMRLMRRLGGLPRDAILRILDKKDREVEKREYGPPPEERREERDEEESSADEPAAPRQTNLDPLEKSLLKVMVESQAGVEYARTMLHHDWVMDRRLAEWIFYLNDNEGFIQTLIDEAEASATSPGDRRVLSAVLAWEVPDQAKTIEAMKQILLRLRERHQQLLTRRLLAMIDQRELGPEDAERLLKAYHQENRTRLQSTGRYLRTGDSVTRRSRMGKG